MAIDVVAQPSPASDEPYGPSGSIVIGGGYRSLAIIAKLVTYARERLAYKPPTARRIVRWLLDGSGKGFSGIPKSLENLVAGGGFEPPTFGL